MTMAKHCISNRIKLLQKFPEFHGTKLKMLSSTILEREHRIYPLLMDMNMKESIARTVNVGVKNGMLPMNV